MTNGTTRVHLLSNVPFNISYNNVRDFTSLNEQQAYFLKFSKYEIDNNTYQRVNKNSIQLEISYDAMLEIITKTQGYPFFIQALAYNIWNNAKGLNINIDDVKKAFEITLKSLDEGFFKVRFERISPKETQFVEKMAILGKGPYLYSHITDLLEGETKSWSPVRSSLIKKGMIFSPKFKYLDFTVPLFSDYVNRALNRREN